MGVNNYKKSNTISTIVGAIGILVVTVLFTKMHCESQFDAEAIRRAKRRIRVAQCYDALESIGDKIDIAERIAVKMALNDLCEAAYESR